jgi:hypothetical protein
MSSNKAVSNITAPTQFLEAGKERTPTAGSEPGPACLSCASSTSRERWTIGIRPLLIRLRRNGR